MPIELVFTEKPTGPQAYMVEVPLTNEKGQFLDTDERLRLAWQCLAARGRRIGPKDKVTLVGAERPGECRILDRAPLAHWTPTRRPDHVAEVMQRLGIADTSDEEDE